MNEGAASMTILQQLPMHHRPEDEVATLTLSEAL